MKFWHRLRKAQENSGKRIELEQMTGEQAVALGLARAGVEFLAGVPAFPGAALVSQFAELVPSRRENVGWYARCESAVEAAFGATLSGMKAAVVCNGNDFPDALRLTASMGLAKNWPAGLLLVVIDDIGTWYDSIESDARYLASYLGFPVFEPISIPDALSLIPELLTLSEQFSLPVLLRLTSGFCLEGVEPEDVEWERQDNQAAKFRLDGRILVRQEEAAELKIQAAHRLKRLQENVLRDWYGNTTVGEGQIGLISCGYVTQKLLDVLDPGKYPVRLLNLSALWPLSPAQIMQFLSEVNEVYLLEEGMPVVEDEIRLIAWQNSFQGKISGKRDEFFPAVGEMFRWSLEEFLEAILPEFESRSVYFPFQEQKENLLPESLFPRDLYARIFAGLRHASQENFPNSEPIWVAARGSFLSQLIKSENRVLVSLNSAGCVATAGSLSRFRRNRPVIAVVGDHSFFKTGLNSLIDSAYHKSNFVLVLLDNGMAVGSGFQPTAGSGVDVKGRSTIAIELSKLLQALPVRYFGCSLEGDQLESVAREALGGEGIRILHVKLPSD